GGTRALLVADSGLKAAGHPQRALQALHAGGVEAWVFDGVEENPTDRHVAAALDVAQAHRVDFLVAVGGGSSMDCAKGTNFLLTNGGRLADYKGFGQGGKAMAACDGGATEGGAG